MQYSQDFQYYLICLSIQWLSSCFNIRCKLLLMYSLPLLTGSLIRLLFLGMRPSSYQVQSYHILPCHILIPSKRLNTTQMLTQASHCTSLPGFLQFLVKFPSGQFLLSQDCWAGLRRVSFVGTPSNICMAWGRAGMRREAPIAIVSMFNKLLNIKPLNKSAPSSYLDKCAFITP